jgi:VCBS repeat-containing protein
MIAQSDLTEQTDTNNLEHTITVGFTDVDLNDIGHTAEVTTVSVSGEDGGLTLTDTQLIALITPGAATKNAGEPTGTVDLSFSAASTVFDYLAKDEVVTLTYTVKISDGDGGEDTEQFVITVTGTNDAPVITVNDPAAVDEGNTGVPDVVTVVIADQVSISDVDTNDVKTDYVAGTLVFDSAAGPAPSVGTLEGLFVLDAANGKITYDRAAFDYLSGTQTVTASFTFDSSSGPDTEPGTITITINGLNDAPVAMADTRGATEDVALIAAASVLANDTDAEAEDLNVAAVKVGAAIIVDGGSGDLDGVANGSIQFMTTAGGTATIDLENGTFNYVQNGVFNALNVGNTGVDSFQYQAIDGTDASNFATVTINVSGVTDVVNQAPTDISLNVSAVGGGNALPGAGTIATFSTTDPDAGDTFVYSLLGGSSAGFTVSPSGTLAATVNLVENTIYTLNVQTQDQGGTGSTFSETFNIITGSNAGGGSSGDDNPLPTDGSGNPILNGDDVLYGSGGNDFIFGGSGNDSIFGNNGSDTLVGGAGNDTLSGAQDSDTFRWNAADQGTTLAPAVDIVTNFSITGNKDTLNLQDLLQGESHTGNLAGNLANFLHFSTSGGNTTIEVSTTGAFSNQTVGGTIGGGDQTIQLTAANLVGAGASQDAIIQNLFTSGLLVTS